MDDLRRMGEDSFPPVLVLHHPSMEEPATRLVEVARAKVTEKSLSEKRRNYRRVEISHCVKWDHFRDGWPNIFIDSVEEIAGRDVIMFASFHSPEVIFEQLSLCYSLPRYLVRSFRLILPFFPTATMERVDKEGQVVTAKSLATMLSAIPLAARGPTQIFVFDIHALQERFYFGDQVIPRLLSAIPLLIRVLEALPDCSNLAMVFPDEGAYKRFHSALPSQWPTITCGKMRDGDKRVVTVKDGDPKDRHVVIVDDLVQTGSTLIECAKVLKKRGATAISLYVTHAVFPKESWRRFTGGEMEFANFWITDSLPHAITIAKHSPFKLIPLCEIIADSLLGYDLLSCNQ